MGFMDLPRARQALAAAGLDALLLLSPRHLYYATGHSSWFLNLYGEAGYGAAVIPVDGEMPGVLVSDVEDGPIRATAPAFGRVATYPAWVAFDDVPPAVEEDLFEYMATHAHGRPAVRTGQVDVAGARALLVDLLRTMGLDQARIGIELTFAGAPWLAELQAALPKAVLVEASPLVEQLRAVKSVREAELLRRGTELAEAAIGTVVERIRPGMTAGAIARTYRAAVFEHAARQGDGGDVLSARLTLRVGPQVLQPQAAGSYAVQPGDLVFLDCGVEVASYWADMGRCFVLGKANSTQRRLYAALRSGFDAAIDRLWSGNSPADVIEAGLAAVHATGLTSYVRGNVGHGVGLHRAPELPILGREETLRLAPGHVVSVEFPLYLQGVGALQVEDTFWLREGDRICFNQLSRDLVEV